MRPVGPFWPYLVFFSLMYAPYGFIIVICSVSAVYGRGGDGCAAKLSILLSFSRSADQFRDRPPF